jgi:hypothetical protein
MTHRPVSNRSQAVLPTVLRLAAVALAAAQFSSFAAAPAGELAAAANKFLGTLSAEQKAKAVYELKSEARHQWHFIPTEMVSFGRKGVPFKELKPEQRELALALLRASMSDPGFKKATQIMSLESILKAIEQNARVDRNPELYFVSVYGKPDAKGAWAWRFEGHHLSLNFTVVDGRIVSTPSFMGTNPAEVREGPHKGLRVLAKEEDLARELVKSLSADQKTVAVFSKEAPKDIITAADRQARRLDPPGIAFGNLNKEQQAQLRRVVDEYANRTRLDAAKLDLEKITKAGWDKVYFAWAGGLERGDGHYYRVQGPTFLLEYDNTQNNANHVHAVWRDLADDFGEDLLRKHYEREHAK